MRAVWAVVASVAVLGAVGWLGWHYLQFRSCGERTCPPLADREPLSLASGAEVPLVATRVDERGRVVLDYLTRHDRGDVRSLCAEARAVWEAARAELDTRRLEHALLGPTSPTSEFLGMRYGVVPLYTCCVTTPLRVDRIPSGGRVDRIPSGGWSFPDCPRD